MNLYFDNFPELKGSKDFNNIKQTIQDVINLCEENNFSKEQTAYVLATIHKETFGVFKIEKEIGYRYNGPYGFWKINLRGEEYCHANDRGIDIYFYHQYPELYYGRGLIPLRWFDTYKRVSEELFKLNVLSSSDELLKNPEVALEPYVAKLIVVKGIENGWFTGRKLREFIDEHHCDFAGARKVITDSADVSMESLAKKFLINLNP